MWRTVIVASGEKLNIKDNWLIVSSAEGESRVPVSDIYSLVIENRAAMLSVSVLTTLTQAGADIILCDEKHLPVSAALPINTHYRPFNVIKKQIDMTYEFKNLLWQKIIERKIHNRYLCLKYREINKEKCDEIDALSKSVKPGNTTNREAVAARKYFVAFENCDTLFETLTYSNRKSLIDLPNQIILQSDKRKQYSQFRKNLIKSGFIMVQFSVYARTVRNNDDAKKYSKIVKSILPPSGSVRLLIITDRQYDSMGILIGEKYAEENYLDKRDIIEL